MLKFTATDKNDFTAFKHATRLFIRIQTTLRKALKIPSNIAIKIIVITIIANLMFAKSKYRRNTNFVFCVFYVLNRVHVKSTDNTASVTPQRCVIIYFNQYK